MAARIWDRLVLGRRCVCTASNIHASATTMSVSWPELGAYVVDIDRLCMEGRRRRKAERNVVGSEAEPHQADRNIYTANTLFPAERLTSPFLRDYAKITSLV